MRAIDPAHGHRDAVIQSCAQPRHYFRHGVARADRFFLIVDHPEQRLLRRCYSAATPLFPALLSRGSVRC
jgi:hypothetical protein